MSSIVGMNEPGTYVVTTDSNTQTTVECDSLDYSGPDGSLQAWKDGAVIATWRWWTSIVRKKD